MKVKIYDQIINDIMDDIHYGNLKPGEKLPTYAELAKKYSTSIVTVRKSISSLINKGSSVSHHRPILTRRSPRSALRT